MASVDEKISKAYYQNESGEWVLRAGINSLPAVALPSKWDDIAITNNDANAPTIIKYYLDSEFLMKVTITYADDNETITRVQTSLEE